MTDLNNIDFTTGTLYVKLTTERAKRRGAKVEVTDDITWRSDQDATIEFVQVYGHVQIRDWRWLWLRRKTIGVPITTVDLR